MKIIAYTYEAAIHCVACAKKRFDAGKFSLDNPLDRKAGLDENGIDYRADDNEGNALNPVFSTDEIPEDECCDDCFDTLR